MLPIVGAVIGSSTFLILGAVLRPVGISVSLAFAAWFVGGLLSLLGALTYGELSARGRLGLAQTTDQFSEIDALCRRRHVAPATRVWRQSR